MGGVGFPRVLIANFPRNLGTGKWFHYCVSYSTIIRKVHSYGNGLKILSHEFEDESEEPFPDNIFDDFRILKNFRGLSTGTVWLPSPLKHCRTNIFLFLP